MGVNAQTSVPAFTAGQVLTAQQQTQINTGIPVFATTTTRDAAFGGTGEKVLAEGQMAYVENLTGVAQLQYYDGAAWVSLSAGGLVYLTGTTFSAVASFSLPNNTFSSTYRNYKIIIEVTSSATAACTMRMRASGTDNTSVAYSGGLVVAQIGTGTATDDTNVLNAFDMGGVRTSFGNTYTFDIIAPQVATKTIWAGSCTTTALSTAASYGGGAFGGTHDSTTQFDALSFIISGANTITGNYRVYGYADS